MQSRHVLLQSVGLNVAHRFLRHRSANHELAVLIFFRKGEIGLTVTENIHSRFKILLIAERDFKVCRRHGQYRHDGSYGHEAVF